MGRGKGKKSPIDKEAKLIADDEFCSTVNAAPEEVLRGMLKQLPLDRINWQERLKGDADVKNLREQMATAMVQYRTAFKRIDAKAARIRRRLKEMGKSVGDFSEEEGKTLEPGVTDKFGGTNADALAGKPTEPRPSSKAVEQKAVEKSVKDFEFKVGSHPNSPLNTKN